MATFQDYPFAPTTAVLDGLHSRTDWETPSPTAAQPCMARSGSPPPYSPAGYGFCYDAHEVSNCMQARLLCEQRFATLKAQVDDLNGYCQRSQCTWCRTKSFFKRALSLKSRKKMQQAPEKGQEHEVDGHTETHPSSPVEKPPVTFGPAELLGREFEPAELPAGASFHTQAPAPFSQPDVYQYHSNPYGQFPGCSGAAVYQTNDATGAVQQPAFGHPQAQAHHAHELAAARPPHLTIDTATPTPYPAVPSQPFSGVSFVSAYTAFSPDGHPIISPHSSISSISSTSSAPASAGFEQGPLLFANQATCSPVEYAAANGNNVDWFSQATAAHDNSWDSVTTAVELPDTSLVPELAATQWQHEPVSEATPMPLQPAPMPLVFSNFGSIQPMMPMAPMESDVGAQLNLDPSLWPTSQAVNAETAPRMPTWPPLQSPFQVQTTLRRPRRNSWDSTTSTVLDVQIAENHNPLPTPEYSPISPAYMDLPSQQRQKQHHQHQQRRPADRCAQPPRSHPKPPKLSPSSPSVSSPSAYLSAQVAALPPQQPQQRPNPTHIHTQPQDILCCVKCHFFPHPGPDQRKKLARHRLTDRHRRNTTSSEQQQQDGGTPAGPRRTLGEPVRAGAGAGPGTGTAGSEKPFPCRVPGCGSGFNREDNLWQHVKKKHDGVWTRGRRRLVLRGVEPGLQLAWGAGVVGVEG